MRIFIVLAILILSGTAAGGEPPSSGRNVSLADLAFMPPYCRGTQLIRDVSKDPKSVQEYVATYGKPFIHLHHYCWALNWERKAWREKRRGQRDWKLERALGDIKYVLDRSDAGFVLLPEIYSTQAKILSTLDRDPLAISALQNAIKAKPDYVPAYIKLSDYYIKANNKTQAIKILEQGIDNTENAATLIKQLERLGITYKGVPGGALKKKATQDSETSDHEKKTAPLAEPANISEPRAATSIEPPNQSSSDNPPETPNKDNPYCRFCP
jgi:tetratricopeptide (TPR) repeat protein